MTPDDAEMMFLTGKQFWLAARDLQERAQAMPDAKTPIRQSRRAWGHGLTAVILRPFATEYLLKGLSARDTGGFLPTHDLFKLYAGLDPDTQAEISAQGSQRGIDVPEFLDEHRNAFEDWRYPIEGISLTPNLAGFDNMLAVLVGAWKPSSSEPAQPR